MNTNLHTPIGRRLALLSNLQRLGPFTQQQRDRILATRASVQT